jgi:hypothetical protein
LLKIDTPRGLTISIIRTFYRALLGDAVPVGVQLGAFVIQVLPRVSMSDVFDHISSALQRNRESRMTLSSSTESNTWSVVDQKRPEAVSLTIENAQLRKVWS